MRHKTQNIKHIDKVRSTQKLIYSFKIPRIILTICRKYVEIINPVLYNVVPLLGLGLGNVNVYLNYFVV